MIVARSHVRESSGLVVSTFQSLFYWPLLRPANNAAQVSFKNYGLYR